MSSINKSTSSKDGHTLYEDIIIGVVASLMVCIILFALSSKTTNKSSDCSKTISREVRYTHGTVNVRAGQGTRYPVVKTLVKYSEVFVDSAMHNWVPVYQDSIYLGYVYKSLLYKSILSE